MTKETKKATKVENQEVENFAELFEDYVQNEKTEGTVVKGKIVSIKNGDVYVDVGLKSEGRISIREFLEPGQQLTEFTHKVGENVDVYIDRLEDRRGATVLSRTMAIREEAWDKYRESHEKNENVDGVIIGRVKGGFAVDLNGLIAFLPGSQVDIRPIKDISALINIKQPFKILKMDEAQGNVVVSRRAILEESRAEARDALLANVSEGSTLEGVVKNITDYGAFIDLGSIDGLLHITDISWGKINHPSEVLTLGQTINVMVIKYNEETKRVSLGLKQLEKNPWEGLEDKYKVGERFSGTITTVADYGAFVELEDGVEGLVYHTEISWGSKNAHPRKLVKTGDKVDVVVVDLDISKHKIGLSIKQCLDNPWEKFSTDCPIDTKVKAKVKNVADFGVFVEISGYEEAGIEGLIPAVELSWSEKPEVELKKYKKDDELEAIVLGTDVERERITLGVRQLGGDKFADATKAMNKGDVVTCTVTEVNKDGIEVELSEGVKSFIKRMDLSKHKSEQRPERFGVGDKVDAKVTIFDSKDRKFAVSIKALEIEEEKKTIAEYGSVDSGASLGEILGVALGKEDKAEEKKAKPAAKKKAAPKAKKEEAKEAVEESKAENA